MVKDAASEGIARRIARELRAGDLVNLGVGIPTLVADFIPEKESQVFLQTENGLLGVGPSPAPGTEDLNLVNAGKLPVTEESGASYFSSAQSFAMIRGRHIDVAILGVLQVDRYGRIANWAIPGKTILGVGGAMDLLVGAKKIIVATTHLTKDGQPKIVSECTYPLTGSRSVDLIFTDYATFSVDADGLILEELMPGITLEQMRLGTGAPFRLGRALEQENM